MTDTRDNPAPHEAQLTSRACVHCGEQQVILVYERFSSRVLLCLRCEQVWTDEPGSEPP